MFESPYLTAFVFVFVHSNLVCIVSALVVITRAYNYYEILCFIYIREI